MFGQNKTKDENKKDFFSGDKEKYADVLKTHTMRDDLNSLEGRIEMDGVVQVDEKTEEVKNSESRGPFFRETVKNAESAKKESKIESPIEIKNENKRKIGRIFPEAERENEKKQPENNAVNIESDNPVRWGVVFAALTIFLALAAALGGGYYFWATRSVKIETPQDNNENNPNENIPAAPALSISSENPNYFRIDTENATKETISESIKNYSAEAARAENGKLFEFVVTDADNDPIAFSRFAYLFELDLSQSIMDDLDESFSLYIYNDESLARTALAIAIKDNGEKGAKNLQTELIADESRLVFQLENIFGIYFIENESVQFKESDFHGEGLAGYEIRYVNLDLQNRISLDYAIVQGNLIIGTSMNANRAVIDKTTSEVHAQREAKESANANELVPDGIEVMAE